MRDTDYLTVTTLCKHMRVPRYGSHIGAPNNETAAML